MSILQKLRIDYKPPIPKILLTGVQFVHEKSFTIEPELQKLFPKTYNQAPLKGQEGVKGASKPLRVGVVFSGGQAPGGHNVVTGLFDALKKLNPANELIGFLDGPSGILNNKTKPLTVDLLADYRNQGGFDLIGSGRTKIEAPEQFEAALKTVQTLKLDGLVIIGGDDSNTNAAFLAEFFLSKGCATKVIGVPKTIDGDLKNPYVPISFGFDTACKIYSEMIGNIARDALSAKKYTHFIKLMGRSASHIALECALKTKPNLCLIGEEVAEKKMTLDQIVQEICAVLSKRAEKGKHYGVILIPEGLIEFIPEVGALISELNRQIKPSDLSPDSKCCFASLPERIQKQLLLDRDPHGNVQVSRIETELLLIEKVAEAYKGKFSPLAHFFGYEGRSGFPSNFDANYCYALGMTAALLIDRGYTGYMCSVTGLQRPVAEWEIGAVPIVPLMHYEMRKGEMRAVIKKALVDLKGRPFQQFDRERGKWIEEDHYQFIGPMQFAGDPALTDSIPSSLQLELS